MNVEKIIKFAQQVIEYADDTGCSDDLTVTCKSAIKNLTGEIEGVDTSISTVNVIEEKTDILHFHSFLDNEKGNEDAEKLFSRCAKENGCEDLDNALEEGYYDIQGYTVIITHST